MASDCSILHPCPTPSSLFHKSARLATQGPAQPLPAPHLRSLPTVQGTKTRGVGGWTEGPHPRPAPTQLPLPHSALTFCFLKPCQGHFCAPNPGNSGSATPHPPTPSPLLSRLDAEKDVRRGWRTKPDCSFPAAGEVSYPTGEIKHGLGGGWRCSWLQGEPPPHPALPQAVPHHSQGIRALRQALRLASPGCSRAEDGKDRNWRSEEPQGPNPPWKPSPHGRARGAPPVLSLNQGARTPPWVQPLSARRKRAATSFSHSPCSLPSKC